jgi:fatty-acyl-CoA synthase
VIAREFDPTKVLDSFETSGITKLFMVPAAMQFVVRQPRAREVGFSKLRCMLYGASPIPAALLKECIEVFKCGFVQMYGMTETTGTIVALPPEDHLAAITFRERKAQMPCGVGEILRTAQQRLPFMPRQATIVEIGPRPFAAMIEEADIVIGVLDRLDLFGDEAIELVEIGDQIARQRKIQGGSPGCVLASLDRLR